MNTLLRPAHRCAPRKRLLGSLRRSSDKNSSGINDITVSDNSSSIDTLGSPAPWKSMPSDALPPLGQAHIRHCVDPCLASLSPDSEPSFYACHIDRYAAMALQPITLHRLLHTGTPPLTRERLLANAQYLHKERPVRYAKHVKLFQQLPFIVNLNPNLHALYTAYYAHFEELRQQPEVRTEEDQNAFVAMLVRQSDALCDVMPGVARGFHECRAYLGAAARGRFLNELIHTRIALRLLTDQHIALHRQLTAAQQQQQQGSGVAGAADQRLQGIIDTRLSLADAVRASAQEVQAACELTYGDAPAFTVDDHTGACFCYVAPHLDYVLTEILKNAFRASVQSGHVAHPVEITVAQGAGHVAVRVRDSGGGIPRKIRKRVFDYAFTTAADQADVGQHCARAGAHRRAGLRAADGARVCRVLRRVSSRNLDRGPRLRRVPGAAVY
ncbi:hypothetical protein GGF37_004101 [Kickxella alabastrina]|nr:hypothetical protein GGF37_004101 [Kickxella alabastrina]